MLLSFVLIVSIKFIHAQINGEFWWLNENLVDYHGVQPPPPMFEELNEFDTDESARIIFRDDNLITNSNVEKADIENENEKEKPIEEAVKHNFIKWPDDDNRNMFDFNIDDKYISEGGQTQLSEKEDKLDFKFPEDNNFVWKDFQKRKASSTIEIVIMKENITEPTTSNRSDFYNDTISFNMNYEEKQSENICTYMKKSECYQCNGVILNMKSINKKIKDRQLICCVLSLEHKKYDSTKIYFPDSFNKLKRLRRSNADTVTENQRRNILQRKHARQRIKPKLPSVPKISTPDYDYDDPYWNIKNVKNPNNKKQESSTRFDYVIEDYPEDYTVEIPRPGLVGLYSDYGQRPTWSVFSENKGSSYGGNDDYDESDSGSFGYSTIDPRLGSTTKIKRGRPQKLTTSSDETGYNAESHTISYHSVPDFNVFQDFKLLNLMRDKNKGSSKISRSTTTESISGDDRRESLFDEYFDSSELTTQEFLNRQVFRSCGRAAKPIHLSNKNKQIGDAVNGSHPWLALVVPTRKQNTVLCYATLVHPRAAITTADCVQSKQAAGELTLIAGLWNLNVRSRARSRVISVRLHPQYKRGVLTHNLALLYWKTPLRLGPNVQPACLANPRADDECMLVGWGGFDQAIRPKSRWQRASVHSCKDRLSLNGVNIPDEAFCTSVQARSTVTGIGGSLMCNVLGREAAVGVAVSRESTLVMLSVLEWTSRTMAELQD